MIAEYIYGKIFIFIFAVMTGIMDYRHMKVEKRVFAAAFIIEAVLYAVMLLNGEKADIWEIFSGFFVGVVIVAISIITKGAIGMGDGVYFCISGIAMGAAAVIAVLAATFFITGIYGIAAAVLGKRNKFIPLLTFTMPVMVVTLFGGIL